MSSRDDILKAVRAAQVPAAVLPEIPHFSMPRAVLKVRFCDGLRLMGGEVAEEGTAQDMTAFMARRFPESGVIRSLVPGLPWPSIEPGTSPASLENVDVAIVRAAFGVAETGSVFLSEAELQVNAVAYLAQHLIVFLDAGDIVGNLHDAYRRAEWHERHYAVLMAGPSATADIEGILIRGAQGVRSLTVVFTG